MLGLSFVRFNNLMIERGLITKKYEHKITWLNVTQRCYLDQTNSAHKAYVNGSKRNSRLKNICGQIVKTT